VKAAELVPNLHCRRVTPLGNQDTVLESNLHRLVTRQYNASSCPLKFFLIVAAVSIKYSIICREQVAKSVSFSYYYPIDVNAISGNITIARKCKALGAFRRLLFLIATID
jgi:hypothetical protein